MTIFFCFYSYQVVCSTAGLCNNAKIDKMLEEYEASKKSNQLSCGQCNNIGNVISHKFHTSSRDQVLDGFLGFCGRMSSFSDACSSMILSYFNEIYHELQKNLNADSICHISGVCSSKFHEHADSPVEIETLSNVGFVKNKQDGDDLPCELCEQLVKHLRDMLTANTTELEFKQVLEGLCKQTNAFKDECVSLVDQYYPIIYETLVNNLDANGACFMIGVCPKGNNPSHSAPSLPMLPTTQKIPKRKLGLNEKPINLMPLPIDQLMGAKSSSKLVDGGQWCTVCQYFLHFLQEELSDAKNEDEIKEAVGRTCDKFPSSIRGNCHNFINMYGDAVIALLVQSVDPREICPQLKMCPMNVLNADVEMIAPSSMNVEINEEAKPTCPLCVLVVKEAEDYIKNGKSKDSVKKALDKVCSRLPPKPQLQCTDFVETYYDELLEKLVSDFSPKDVCLELKLCPSLIDELDENIFRVGIERADNIPVVIGGDINTNEIPDYTVSGQPIDAAESSLQSGECMLCVEVVGGAENKVTAGMKKEQIEDILLRECSRFRAYEGVCDNFVKKNADKIYELLQKQLSPKQICQQLQLCSPKPEDLEIDEAIVVNVVAIPAFPHKFSRVALTSSNPPPKPAPVADDPQCVVCEFIMTKLEAELKDKSTRDEIRTAVENICTKLPNSVSKQCTKFVEQYADLIITLIDTVPPKQICQQMGLCPAQKAEAHLVGANECTWGPSHFCKDHKIAEACKVNQSI